jgi:hypothetical protein
MSGLARRISASPRTYFRDFDFGFEGFLLEAGLGFFAAGFFGVFFLAAGACFAFAAAWDAAACGFGGRVSALACGMATGLHSRFMLVAARPQFLQK